MNTIIPRRSKIAVEVGPASCLSPTSWRDDVKNETGWKPVPRWRDAGLERSRELSGAIKPFYLVAIAFALIAQAGCASVSRDALNVRTFGAVGDGTTKDTAAFQKAIDACAAANGGEVMVPAGNYLIGSIELKSYTTLRLEKGANLLGSPDLDDYPVIKIRWEGHWIDGHRALIFAQTRHAYRHRRAGENFRQSRAERTGNAPATGPHRADQLH